MPDDDKRTHIERLNDVVPMEPVVEPLPEPLTPMIIFEPPKPGDVEICPAIPEWAVEELYKTPDDTTG